MSKNPRLLPIEKKSDIPSKYRGTPIGSFAGYHNLGLPVKPFTQAQLLVGMCMDNRKHLNIPDNFAYIIRAAGANLRYSEFKISYAIGVGGVSHLALIGHTQCGMQNLAEKKEAFIRGLVKRAGWSKHQAEEHFLNFCMMFEIGSVERFILSEVMRLRARYPKICVAPMLYKVEDSRLYFLEDGS